MHESAMKLLVRIKFTEIILYSNDANNKCNKYKHRTMNRKINATINIPMNATQTGN